MSTPLYAELFELYARHRAAHLDYYMSGRRAANCVRFALFQALGLPDENFKTGSATQPWAQLYDISAEGKTTAVAWSDLSNWDDEGRLHFAVGIALSHTLDSFPKSYFWLSYALKVQGEKVLVSENAGDRKEFEFSTEDGKRALVASFFSTLRQYLEQQPEDAFKPKRGIGFL
ncbi:hypothetical protein [Achromobacter mucicolens]|uniref:hypothetical protein n=1 Tax=Achromobacter mucicolens TaxID=1389922 RepID=UPI0022F3DA92|nr:hypothetical protein [Achromobacter mucicolens]WBX91579.1 hypothetical protein PE062_13350 [Achromobacter mucicolens]